MIIDLDMVFEWVGRFAVMCILAGALMIITALLD